MFIPRNRRRKLYSSLILNYFTKKEFKSKVFIDTNILLWSLHINRTAFDELISFLESLSRYDKLILPNWVIFEFDQYVRNKRGIENPYSAISKQLGKSLLNFEKVINLKTDEETAKHLNFETAHQLKSEYKKAKSSIEKILSLGGHKKKGEINSRIEIINQLIRERGSNTKLTEIVKLAQNDFEFRYKNRIPPGYEDDKKETNKHGDLILWYEILEHSRINKNNIALLLTNDNKSDWVAIYPTDEVGYIDAHQFLKHEYSSKINNGEFYLLNMELLIDSFFSTELYQDNIWGFEKFKHLSDALGVKLGNTPTDDIIDWIVKNENINKELAKICTWDFDPSNANLEGMEIYIRENYPYPIKMDEVEFGNVFCEFYL